MTIWDALFGMIDKLFADIQTVIFDTQIFQKFINSAIATAEIKNFCALFYVQGTKRNSEIAPVELACAGKLVCNQVIIIPSLIN